MNDVSDDYYDVVHYEVLLQYEGDDSRNEMYKTNGFHYSLFYSRFIFIKIDAIIRFFQVDRI